MNKIFKVTGLCLLGTAVLGLYTAEVDAASLNKGHLQAGVTVTLEQYLEEPEAAEAENEETQETAEEVNEETAEEITAEEETEEAKPVVEGYTNLGVANVDNHLNVREEPSTEGKLVGQIPKNGGCEILGTEGEWSEIQSGKVTGYVKTEFLFTGDQADEVAAEVATVMATVTTQTLKVRQEASTDSAVLTLIPEGEELEVIEDVDGWVKVGVDSDEGFISDEFVHISMKLPKAVTLTEMKYGEGVSDARVSIVSYATQFVGNPYVWGGTSLTNGADCSGFTMSVMAKYGVSLPHSSSAQSNYGRRISASEAQPGDLFFYGNGGSINHVALYIGNGQVVHASSAKTGIKISNAHYRTPVCVTRVLD